MRLFPELTLIPAEYANSIEAEFEIHLKNQVKKEIENKYKEIIN